MLYEVITILQDISTYHPPTEAFDLIAPIFLHLPSTIRREVHKNLVAGLADNGLMFVHGFNKRQINYKSGGPKDADLLFKCEDIQNDFPSLATQKCRELMLILDEGDGHLGDAETMLYIGKKIKV